MKHQRVIAAALLPALVSLGAGCASTSYKPVANSRVAPVIESNELKLERQGQRYDQFDDAAVAGNSRALERLRAGRRSSTWGMVVGLVGAGLVGVGTWQLGQEGGNRDLHEGLGFGGLLLGLGAIVASTQLQLNGDAAMLDAVNIYNDEATAFAPAAPSKP